LQTECYVNDIKLPPDADIIAPDISAKDLLPLRTHIFAPLKGRIKPSVPFLRSGAAAPVASTGMNSLFYLLSGNIVIFAESHTGLLPMTEAGDFFCSCCSRVPLRGRCSGRGLSDSRQDCTAKGA